MARPAREPSPRRGSPDADPALGRGIAAACAADAVSQGALYLVVLQGCVLVHRPHNRHPTAHGFTINFPKHS